MGTRGQGERGGGDQRGTAATPGCPPTPTPQPAARPPTTIPQPGPSGALPPGPPPAYPLPRWQRGCGGGEGQRGPEGAGRGGDAAVAPRRTGSKSAQARGGSGSGRRQRRSGRRDGGPSESSHTPAAAGTSYWMYCFLHSGVMCAERCSANFILPFPPHSHSGPAVTGGGGGGGNSDSDSSPHGPRRCTALRFSPPPPPPRSPQSRPPAIFLLLSIAPPRPAL